MFDYNTKYSLHKFFRQNTKTCNAHTIVHLYHTMWTISIFCAIHCVVFLYVVSWLPQSSCLMHLCSSLHLYLYLSLLLYLYSICSYDDHVCASLPGPPLRARCLQSKMQIHDRVSGFSRKIEQIIALAPLVTNPLEKYIFSPKRFHLAVVAACMKRKTAKEESKAVLCQTKAIRQNQHIEEAKQTHFGEVVLAGWGKITLRRLQRKLEEEKPLSPRLSGGASASRHNRQTVYFQSITLLCTNTSSGINAETNTCIKYKYTQLQHRQTHHIQRITLCYISLDKPAGLLISSSDCYLDLLLT